MEKTGKRRTDRRDYSNGIQRTRWCRRNSSDHIRTGCRFSGYGNLVSGTNCRQYRSVSGFYKNGTKWDFRKQFLQCQKRYLGEQLFRNRNFRWTDCRLSCFLRYIRNSPFGRYRIWQHRWCRTYRPCRFFSGLLERFRIRGFSTDRRTARTMDLWKRNRYYDAT